ncbi:hypothetical protein NKR23_g5720 [Pleurostoma richardsiae]|uniref:Uncharacterized protein n=1 Tax=Pleurostoma richardsiae TaxID=41990 RepID=A0AA38RGH0_9PEZI|nr:hypothetical protein NKR23_g5720 [Pleurostoma richardsiae]
MRTDLMAFGTAASLCLGALVRGSLSAPNPAAENQGATRSALEFAMSIQRNATIEKRDTGDVAWFPCYCGQSCEGWVLDYTLYYDRWTCLSVPGTASFQVKEDDYNLNFYCAFYTGNNCDGAEMLDGPGPAIGLDVCDTSSVGWLYTFRCNWS